MNNPSIKKNTDTNLENLETLTNNLPTLPTLKYFTLNKPYTGVIEYDVKKGNSLGFPLLFREEVAVQRNFLSKGTEFDYHVHPFSKEILIVISGNIKFNYKDTEEDFNLFKGDLLEIPINIIHNVIVYDDTWVITITLPADKYYPKT